MTASTYVIDALDSLWPGQPDTVSTSPALQLVALPNARSPRVILPLRPWRVSAAALRRYRTSAIGIRRIAAEVGSLGLRIGIGELLPGRMHLPSQGGIDTHLSELLGRRVYVSLYVGPERAVQKPVLQLLDSSGTPVAFAKLAVSAATDALIRHEAETLAGLQSAALSTVRVPSVLHCGSWSSRALLVQEALMSTSRAGVTGDRVVAAANEVAAVGGITEHSLPDSDFVAALHARLSAMAAPSPATRLRSTLRALLATPAPSLSFGSWHGDWAPWNMAPSGSSVLVWDWEGFRTGVPVGFDACHHEVARLVTLQKSAPADAFRALFNRLDAVLGPMGVAADARAWTALLYVLELSTSYLENGEATVGGTPLSRINDWIVPAIEVGTSAVERGGAP